MSDSDDEFRPPGSSSDVEEVVRPKRRRLTPARSRPAADESGSGSGNDSGSADHDSDFGGGGGDDASSDEYRPQDEDEGEEDDDDDEDFVVRKPSPRKSKTPTPAKKTKPPKAAAAAAAASSSAAAKSPQKSAAAEVGDDDGGDDAASAAVSPTGGKAARKAPRLSTGGKGQAPLSASMPLHVKARNATTTLLLQVDNVDLTGDNGTIGRMSERSGEAIVLDLKGLLFEGSVAECNTFLLVEAGTERTEGAAAGKTVAVATHTVDKFLNVAHVDANIENYIEGEAPVWNLDEDEDEGAKPMMTSVDAQPKHAQKPAGAAKKPRKSGKGGGGAKGRAGKSKG